MRKVMIKAALGTGVVVLVSGILAFHKRTAIVAALSSPEHVELFEQPPTPTPIAIPSPTPTAEIATPSTSIKNTKDITLAKSGTVSDALYAKYGEKAIFSIDTTDATHAQGILKSAKGKWWLAFKDSHGNWKIVSEGYSYVTCETVASFRFPKLMVPSCWSRAKNTLVSL